MASAARYVLRGSSSSLTWASPPRQGCRHYVKAADFADFAEIAGAAAVDQTANFGRSVSLRRGPPS
jgi:hypothetical protein